MYQFRPYTERIWNMRERIRDRVIRADSERPYLKLAALKKYEGVEPLIHRPSVSLYILQNMTLRIEDDDYFVGSKSVYFNGSSGAMWGMMVSAENEWTLGDDGLWHCPPYFAQPLCISSEDMEKIRAIQPELMKYQGAAFGPDKWLPDGAEKFMGLGACDYGIPGRPGALTPPGHLTPGFQKIIKVGYGAIRKQAQDWMDEREGNIMGDDMRKYIFYKAATIACDGAMTLTRRFAELAAEKAKTAPTPERKAELEKMSESLFWIAENPARSFWEACQSAILYQLFLNIDNGPGVTAMGRFDQYTWPYLKSDLEKGTITMDEAQELVDAFFLKINTFYGGGFGKMQQTAGVGHLGQHTTIGGVIPETGEDATNPVSYMVLEAMSRLELHEPTVSLRTNKNTPKEIWDCAMATSMTVGGLPLLQNDEVIIPAIINELGFDLEDARNYAFIGCQEITGSGCDYPAPNGSSMSHSGIYWAIALNMAINNGINPMNGAQVPEKLRSGYLYEMKSMDEVRAAFEKIATWMLTWSATLNNYTEHEYPRLFPYPNLSISMTGCMESGRDVSEGGAKYNSYGGTATGLATTADSLTALKYMIFDKKLVSAKEYLDAILANWEGYEPLRQRILSEVPHYGNADPYADTEMKYVIELYYNISRAFSTKRCKVYKCGTFGASDHVAQGEITWATPDGRKTGTPIADACSPAQGRDVNGPTAVFISSTCFDHKHYLDGMALNLKIHPTSLKGNNGITKLEDVTKAYFEKGGMEVQYNVVDAATLRKAQAKPDDYHNLVVRIAGFSAYFVDMTPAMQEDIISRAEHSF